MAGYPCFICKWCGGVALKCCWPVIQILSNINFKIATAAGVMSTWNQFFIRNRSDQQKKRCSLWSCVAIMFLIKISSIHKSRVNHVVSSIFSVTSLSSSSCRNDNRYYYLHHHLYCQHRQHHVIIQYWIWSIVGTSLHTGHCSALNTNASHFISRLYRLHHL